ncbi:hypothetical protein J7T55_014191 [Diaporthe amygdali]|uniref:uncharacterized protein n=1 Tax=Phomopsis amygdali TaxID=1214568 RepID=UPI0022FDFCDF|nr:uncharacterized protein J7T55_014191 [Diaporthe amygdali]KAJ0109629.1 hypothetical protein J7T55_014191 [Diaporthe amygdali]
MTIQPMPSSQSQEERDYVNMDQRDGEMSLEFALKYPIPLFDGESRKPVTANMMIDLVAWTTSSVLPVTRTFEARELINDDVAVRLPVLRSQSFFAEVRKLLIFSGNTNLYKCIWDDEELNKREIGTRKGKIIASTDCDTLWKRKQILEEGKVIELFERATDMGLERMTFRVAWYSSSVPQDISLVKQQLSHGNCNTGSGHWMERSTRSHV